MEGLGVAASVIAVIDLSAKIASICSQYIKHIKNAENDVRRLLQNVHSFGVIVGQIDRLLSGPTAARLKSSRQLQAGIRDSLHKFQDLGSKLQIIEQKLRPHGTRHKIKARLGLTALTWPLGSQEVEKDIQDIAHYTYILSLALQHDQLDIALNTDQVVVLDRLPIATGASFNSLDEESNPTCLHNTRVELLRQILAWVHDPSAKSVFWLNGMAGTGKSTISRTVAHSLFETRHLGASFFFKSGEADRGNVTKFMTTIARQLADRESRLAPMLMSAIEKDSTISGSAMHEQFQKLIFEPLSKITLPDPLVIIVDALDECEGDDKIRNIIHLFARMRPPQIPGVKVLMTSRPDLPIRLGFAKAQGAYQDLILHEIRSEIIEHDISLFLEHKFRSIRDDYNLTVAETQLPPDWPGESKIKALVDLAKPLFISAATACRFISQPSHGHPSELLEEILAYKGKSATSGLDATYLPVLYRQTVGIHSERKRDEVTQQLRKLVGVIVTLESPLSSSSLETLLDIPQIIIDDRLKMLHSVLHIPLSSKDPIRLFHLSFRDFLVDHETRKKTPLWVDEQQMHQDLVAHCLRVMKEKLQRDMCDLRTPGIARSDIDQQTISSHVPPEVEYACLYWVDHLKKGNIHISDGEVRLFLSSYLLYWFEALSLVGRASDSLTILRTLRFILQHQKDEQGIPLVDDAIRFSLAHLSIIDSHPLQIYALIAFLPFRSPMRYNFKMAQWAWVSISGALEQDWGLCLQTLEGHSDVVYSVVFSRDGKYLASASADRTIRLWDATTGQCLQTLEGHSDVVWSVVFSPDGKYLASASFDETIHLWDVTTGQCLQILKGHTFKVRSVVFSPNKKHVASTGLNNTIRLWDVTTGQCLQTLTGHSNRVRSVVFSPYGKYLASASDDETICLWDATTGQCLQTLEGNSDRLWSVAFSPDGKYLASASADGTIRLWDTITGHPLRTLGDHSDTVYSVVFSQDGKYLASASHDGTIRLWDAITSPSLQTRDSHTDLVSSVIFSPDGKHLASASFDQTIRLWDATTCHCLQILEGHSNWVRSAVFSPNGRYLASASDDKNIRLWDATTGQCLQTLTGHSGLVWSVVFSPDGKRLASASLDKTVRLWDATAGHSLQTLEYHSAGAYLVVFSPDGKHLASASHDKTVRLLDATTSQCLQTLEGHWCHVNSMVFSPDGKHLVSASYDGIVRLWSVPTGQCLQAFTTGATSPLSFTPDGSRLFTGAETLIIEKTCLSYQSPPLPADVLKLTSLAYGLGSNRYWVTLGGHKVLWLPVDFRPHGECLAISKSTIAVGSPSGRVTLMCLDTNMLT